MEWGAIDGAWMKMLLRADIAIPAGLAAAGLAFTAASIRSQTRNGRIEKIADILIECTQRFHAVWERLDELETAVAESAMSIETARQRFFFAYWQFQWDQWNYFKLGLVPNEIYADWLYQRLVMIHRGIEILGVPFKDSWTEFGRKDLETYEDFCAFVDSVWALSDQPLSEARGEIKKSVARSFRRARKMRVHFARRSIG